jgi:hypothetical protein
MRSEDERGFHGGSQKQQQHWKRGRLIHGFKALSTVHNCRMAGTPSCGIAASQARNAMDCHAFVMQEYMSKDMDCPRYIRAVACSQTTGKAVASTRTMYRAYGTL